MQYDNLNVQCNEFDEDISFNFKKILFTFWNRRYIIIFTFLSVFTLFVLSTFFLPKKYLVDANLYINKTNNSNLIDINPYVLDEASGGFSLSGTDKSMSNELELMQSPLVIDKVIKENDIRYNKVFGIFKTPKTGKLMKTEDFLKRNIKFENKKNTNIVNIQYKSKDRELAYNIVTSIINYYIDLHKQINSDKSKSDFELLKKEYEKTKSGLNKKINAASGLPETAIAGAGNISAMSAFSSSAKKAISNIKGQYIAGTKSKYEMKEDAEKVSQLSSKLEWAKLVNEMADSSKVLVIKEPQILKEYEQVSPKLFANIIWGLLFGSIAALIAIILAEITYSMLENNIIYNINNDFLNLKSEILINRDKPISIVYFEPLNNELKDKLKYFKNIFIIEADISNEFISQINKSNSVIFFVKINRTETKKYKLIKNMINNLNKKIITEITL